MKLKLSTWMVAGMVCAAMMMTGCKKEGSSSPATVNDTEAQTISEENASADVEDDDVNEIGLTTGADLQSEAGGRVAASDGSNRLYVFAELQFKISAATIITVQPSDSTYPKTVTIDYGAGTICRDGKFRRGKVILQYSAPLRQTGAVLTISLDGYYVNRVHIEGTKKITNLSANGTIKYTVETAVGKFTWPNGRGFTHTGTKVVTQIAGMATAGVKDDVYNVEINGQTVYANGVTVTRTSQTPLVKPVACNWFVQGVLKIKINNRELFVDFGTGTYDNKATLTWSGGVKEITLP